MRPSSPALDPTVAAPTSSVPAPLKYRERERYEIRGEQGRGGLGLVWRAHDHELGRDVAVKELLSRGNTSELRFFREALITSRLEHPGIVPVHEAGRWSDGTPFYTMKLVGGRSLHECLGDERTVEGRLAFLANVIVVVDAIAYAHDHGVIHRDLKPSNVMVGDFGETIVIDWGLAKTIDENTAYDDRTEPYRNSPRVDVTAVGSVIGTPAYMAPEQYDGDADHRSDIYALGGIVHHLLTGSSPHGRALPASRERAFEYGRNLPADLVAIVRRAMSPDPSRRYQNARDLAEDLKRYMRRERVTARRYSIAARSALAFARHRNIALVAIAALTVLTVTLAISFLKVRGQRANAIEARQQAIVNSAAALADRDPTNAWKILQTIPLRASPPLLRAQIKAGGIADHTISLHGRFVGAQVVAAGSRVIIATGERVLCSLDTRTGNLTQIADGLTEPPVYRALDDRVYFIRQKSGLTLAQVPVNGGPIVDLVPLDALPSALHASDAGVFWLGADGVVYGSTHATGTHVVARNVSVFRVVGSLLVTCTDGMLLAGELGATPTRLGTCDPDGAWNADKRGFIHSTSSTFYSYSNGRLRTVVAHAGDEMHNLQRSAAGLVAAIGRGDDGLLLRESDVAVEHVRLPSHPQIVSAHGTLAGWAFGDGSVHVVDTKDERTWTIQAVNGMPWCFALLTDDRMMSCDRQTVRLWSLHEAAPAVIATLPLSANNVAFNAAGDALLDGLDATAYLIRKGESHAVALHKHDNFTFGVRWCGANACSSGWDGRVRCTNAQTRATTVVDFHSVTILLAEAQGRCYVAAAAGGVYDVSNPTVPLYKHRQEPYRLASSADGQYLASGDWGGDLVVYDLRATRIAAEVRGAHKGRMTGAVWLGGNLVTTGVDGTVRLWSASLTPLRAWQFDLPVRYVDANGGTIAATLDDGRVYLLSDSDASEHHVATGATLYQIAVSPDGELAAVGTNDGYLLVISKKRRSAAVRLERGRISCVGFETNQSIFACTASSGHVMRVPTSALLFEQ
jgi:WD40 repeat protein